MCSLERFPKIQSQIDWYQTICPKTSYIHKSLVSMNYTFRHERLMCSDFAPLAHSNRLSKRGFLICSLYRI